MSERAFHQLISGETAGPAAACGRLVLSALSVPYRAVIAARNAAYDFGWKTTRRISVPVISIGNLTTGGTGKTPVVAAMVRMLLSSGHMPGIVSRGYRADSSGTNDEKRVLELLCPGFLTNRTRIVWSRRRCWHATLPRRRSCWTTPSSIAESTVTSTSF
ncbi:MAG: tetraacyldisaccharide 4'-kinase [Planctomycetaceae bacterium]